MPDSDAAAARSRRGRVRRAAGGVRQPGRAANCDRAAAARSRAAAAPCKFNERVIKVNYKNAFHKKYFDKADSFTAKHNQEEGVPR